MFNPIDVFIGLMLILPIFGLFQVLSGGVFYCWVARDQRGFSIQHHFQRQRTARGDSLAVLEGTHTTLTRSWANPIPLFDDGGLSLWNTLAPVMKGMAVGTPKRG
ncbi:Tar ligand binding domain-containing protein [Martelella alba]|uniref:Chemotaxis methyl-accepting receptor Tar-related ligand-binding domain-containing protein n=1 Tax=Martelella alba TaxID=2590451 RepID=A0ABY2SRV2_9HYPH|nr:Tar ligand binding domain-containing protein [Martelella alba]TKI08308.1 hypothetical protein FCN80_03970 [Martelella alba]